MFFDAAHGSAKMYFGTAVLNILHSQIFSTATHLKQKVVFLMFFCLVRCQKAVQKDIFASHLCLLQKKKEKSTFFFAKQKTQKTKFVKYKYGGKATIAAGHCFRSKDCA